MYNSTEIANNIKKIAKNKGIVLKTMFYEIGIGENTMSNFKKSMPKVDTLGKIADYLNVSMDYLTGRTEESTQNNFMNNNNTVNGGVQTQNYNASAPQMNGIQKEMLEAMEQLPKSKQLKALEEVYKILEENKE